MAKRLPKLLDTLAKRYEADGKKAELTELRDPFQVGAWQILGSHAKRNGQARAYEALRRAKGVTPGQLLDIPPEKLHTICQAAGPYEDQRARELYAYADQIEEKCGQDFKKVFRSQNEARKFLEKDMRRKREFVELLLLYGGGFAVFPTDARIVRVASRLGLVKLKKANAVADEKAANEVQKTLEAEIGKDAEAIIRAHGLLFRLANDLCTATAPACDQCPLLKECPYGQAHPVEPRPVPAYGSQRYQSTRK